MVEAVLGQLFLVTMLARVVGMLGVQRGVPEELAMAGSGEEDAQVEANELAELRRLGQDDAPDPGSDPV